jgi:hypothetical protein
MSRPRDKLSPTCGSKERVVADRRRCQHPLSLSAILGSLLPGARETRASLAAGLLWLFAAWLAFHEAVPESDEASGAVAAVYELRDVLGPIPTAGGVALVAYLIGSLSVAAAAGVMQASAPAAARMFERMRVMVNAVRARATGRARRPPPRVYDLPVAVPFLSRGAAFELLLYAEAVMARVKEKLAPRSREWQDQWVRDNLGGFEEYVLPEKFGGEYSGRWLVTDRSGFIRGTPRLALVVSAEQGAQTLFRDLNLLRRRLIGVDPELFATVDRYDAEAEFRIGTAWPLALAVVVAAFGLGWPWWGSAAAAVLGVALCALVAAQGVARKRAANDLLVDMLRLNRLSHPVIERAFGNLPSDGAESLEPTENGESAK